MANSCSLGKKYVIIFEADKGDPYCRVCQELDLDENINIALDETECCVDDLEVYEIGRRRYITAKYSLEDKK